MTDFDCCTRTGEDSGTLTSVRALASTVARQAEVIATGHNLGAQHTAAAVQRLLANAQTLAAIVSDDHAKHSAGPKDRMVGKSEEERCVKLPK